MQRVWQGDDPKELGRGEFDGDRVVKLELNELDFGDDKLTSSAGGDRAAHVAEELDLDGNQLTSCRRRSGSSRR